MNSMSTKDDAAHEASELALLHGLVMSQTTAVDATDVEDAAAKQEANRITHLPITLTPYVYPRHLFELAIELQNDVNVLIHRVAQDTCWLNEALQGTVQSDKGFTGRLLDIYNSVKSAMKSNIQQYELGILRTDYMLHQYEHASDDTHLKMVEINTISSAFAGMAGEITAIHDYIAKRHSLNMMISESKFELPKNDALAGVALGLKEGYDAYMKCRSDCNEKAATVDSVAAPVILMVVQPGELNSFDQRRIIEALFVSHGIHVIRRSLRDIRSTCGMDNNDKSYDGQPLFINGVEVAVVYFRAGYTPSDYPSEAEWDARVIIEHSKAVKCPSVGYHLVGAKKVQQVLAEPGVLERFLPDRPTEAISMLRSTFAGLYSLDVGIGDAATARALSDPDGYVLKPQREGGGNNLYGNDIVQALGQLPDYERAAYILMERIRAPTRPGVLLRCGIASSIIPLVCELGIFGIILGCGDSVHESRTAGFLLRSKAAASLDGGVAAGVAVLDSPALV